MKPNILGYSPKKQHEQEVLTFLAKQVETKKKKKKAICLNQICTTRLLSSTFFFTAAEQAQGHKAIKLGYYHKQFRQLVVTELATMLIQSHLPF